MKGFSKSSLIITCVAVFFTSLILVSAVSTWSHNITGQVPNNGLGFSVYKDEACTQLWDGSIASVVADLSQPYTEIYYIKNTQNSQITVTGVVNAGTTTYAWGTNGNSIVLAPSTVGSLSLSLSNYNGGVAGDFTVIVTFSAS